jgi:LDH2 family malate/lactate/ureidoglycolate dehydrogenase
MNRSSPLTPSVVVDMATSKRAWGEVRLSDKFNRNLPKETYFDKKGKFAQDPKDAYSALPAGGYKGFALGLLIEILTGSMLEMLMGSHKLKGDYRTLPRGGFILVVNPRKTTNLDKFKSANIHFMQEIKNSKKLRGRKEILIPGERAMRARKENLRKGYLEVDKSLWEEIKGGLESIRGFWE